MKLHEIDLREDGTSRLVGLELEPFISTGRKKTRPAIIICPGGAYMTLAYREAEPAAARFAGMGFQVFILYYPTYLWDHKKPQSPAEARFNENAHLPEPIVDAMQAMAWVRGHADELDVDANRVYMLGFSAGAHLVCSLAERFDDEELLSRAGTDAQTAKPTGILLCYPMLSGDCVLRLAERDGAEFVRMQSRALFGTDEATEEQLAAVRLADHVRPDMPRCFMWHNAEDTVTDPRESTKLAFEMLCAGVPCELHLFERGPHGQSLCDETSSVLPEHLNPAASVWPELARTWLAADAAGTELSHEA